MPLVGASWRPQLVPTSDQTAPSGMGEAQTICCMVLIGLSIGCLFVACREALGVKT